MGRNAAKDKADLVWRRAHRHAEPDARHRRLEGERISDVDGQQAASRLRSHKLPQVSSKLEIAQTRHAGDGQADARRQLQRCRLARGCPCVCCCSRCPIADAEGTDPAVRSYDQGLARIQ